MNETPIRKAPKEGCDHFWRIYGKTALGYVICERCGGERPIPHKLLDQILQRAQGRESPV